MNRTALLGGILVTAAALVTAMAPAATASASVPPAASSPPASSAAVPSPPASSPGHIPGGQHPAGRTSAAEQAPIQRPGTQTAPAIPLPTADISTEPAALTSLTLTGHGSGHGRGMGQWGAYGYALQGWTYQQILAHFYGNATLSSVPAAGAKALISVRLFGQDGKDLTVTSGAIFVAGGVRFAPGTSARIHLQADGSMLLYRLAGACTGTVTALGRSASGLIQTTSAAPGDDLTRMLTVCGTDRRTYRGMLTMVGDRGAARTVNTVYLHDYLVGVVPRESYASWGDGGAGKGANALRAQAVAARTYALAEHRYSYADTCDDTHCQMYSGAGLNGTLIEDRRTNDAVTVTDGQALLVAGKFAYAEFGTSSGGYTAGGQFPAVPDAGDAVAGNPYHNWTRTANPSSLGPAHGVGTLTGIQVLTRDGRGADGGRVLTVRLTGTGGTATVTGDDVRRALSLPSNWFVVHSATSTGTLRAVASDTGRPVPGVRYGLYARCTGTRLSQGTTGSDGSFPITAVPGAYCARMEAVPTGFLAAAQAVTFTVLQGTAFTVTSTVAAGVQQGTVTVRDNAGNPVPRVVLTFFGASCTAGPPTSTVSTGADGSHSLRAWPGSLCVVIRSVPAGYRFDRTPVAFTVESQTPLAVVLTVTRL